MKKDYLGQLWDDYKRQFSFPKKIKVEEPPKMPRQKSWVHKPVPSRDYKYYNEHTGIYRKGGYPQRIMKWKP